MDRALLLNPTEAQTQNTGGSPPEPAVCSLPLSACCLGLEIALWISHVCRGWSGAIPWVAPWNHKWRCVPVADTVGAGVVSSDNDKDVLKM